MEELKEGVDPNTPSSTQKTTYSEFLMNNKTLADFLKFITRYPPTSDKNLKSYYRRIALQLHPDKKGDPVDFQLLGNLYGFFTKGAINMSEQTLEQIVAYIRERLKRVKHEAAEAAAAGGGGAAAAAAGGAGGPSPPAAAAAAAAADGGSFPSNPPDNATAGMGSGYGGGGYEEGEGWDNATAGMGGEGWGNAEVHLNFGGGPPRSFSCGGAGGGGGSCAGGGGSSSSSGVPWDVIWARNFDELLGRLSREAEAERLRAPPPEYIPTSREAFMAAGARMAERKAAAEWAAGAEDRRLDEEAREEAKRLAEAAQAERDIHRKRALEQRAIDAYNRSQFIRRYGLRARSDDPPYELARLAASRAASRLRATAEAEAAVAEEAASGLPSLSKRARIGSPPDPRSGGGGSSSSAAAAAAAAAALVDTWLVPGVQEQLLKAPTSEEMELFSQREFWVALSNANCNHEKRKDFQTFGRPNENFDTFYERVRIYRYGRRPPEEAEKGGCAIAGGYRKKSTRSKRGRKGRKSHRHSRK